MNILAFMSFSVLSAARVDDPVPPMPDIAPLRSVVDPDVRLPEMSLPSDVPVAHAVPVVLNPALIFNASRPINRDIGGFGPAQVNTDKKSNGTKCYDLPICTDVSHETFHKRKNAFRVVTECRGCVKKAAEDLPDHATRWQKARFLNATFRSYFCTFCFLECDDDKMHAVVAKGNCQKHSVANRLTNCKKHGTRWHCCKECPEDPRSGTFYCACGQTLSGPKKNCRCAAKVSYGVRLHTDPFVVPTAEVRAIEDKWAADSLARAEHLQANPDEEVPPPKRQRRSAGRTMGPYLKPFV